MSGIAGGTIDGSSLREAIDGIGGHGRETAWQFEHGNRGLGLSTPTVDPAGSTTWDDGSRGGVVDGVVTNLAELGWTDADLFERLLDRPVETAAAIEGEFLIACYDGDDDRFVVVTDKLGARSCYYTAENGFHFATTVDVLLAHVDDPSLDVQAASDMLLMGHLWGDRTLVDGVTTMRAATVTEAVDGEVSTRRYWTPDYDAHAGGDAYFDELARRYDQAVARFADTLPETAGIWLSGGLDSRTTAAALLDHTRSDGFRTLRAFGYDANPPTNDNPRIATEVAETLGMTYEQVPLSGETFAGDFERVVEATDGMLRWNTAANLSASYRVGSEIPVLMEGMQGELVGDHLLRYHLDDSQSVVSAQRNSEASTSLNTVDRLLNPRVDPLRTFKDEADRAAGSTHRAKVMDVHFRNYYARLGLASNALMRDRGGSRSLQVDGDYLEWCAKIPRASRKGTFPLSERVFTSDAGGVPYGTSPAKLELCRRISPETASITYERTKVKPSRPYPLHAAGFVGNVVTNRLRQKATYGSGQLQDVWIRDANSDLHRRVAGLVDDAADRALFTADAVREVFDDHMDGANNAALLAQITTLEYWLQAHLD